MRKILLLAALLVAWPALAIDTQVPAAKIGLDLDSDGIRDCLDNDGDNQCEVSGMWDADGDGSTYVTCTGDGTPFPQCLYSGDVIYPDFSDDLNCMIPAQDGSAKCSNTYTMEWAGVVQLRDGVRYIAFPCWDIADWLADANTPGALPADTDLNDPRNQAAIAAEGSTRHNDAADGSQDDCPQDENSFELASITTHYWQGTIRGEGRPSRRLHELSAAEPLRGTMIVEDSGRMTDAWYGESAGRTFQVGQILSATDACKHPSTACGQGVGGAFVNASQRGGKGWGQLTLAVDWQDLTPTICVCDSDDNDCAVVPGTATEAKASADDWIDDLEDGDVVVFDYDAAPGADTRNIHVPVRIDGDGDTFVQGACADAESKEVIIGWAGMSSIHANMDQGVGWQKNTDCTAGNTQCGIFHLPPEHYSAGFRLENLTWTLQDTPNRDGDDCDTSGSITAFADAGGGLVEATSAGHNLTNSRTVVIAGTTNYNGEFLISSVATDTFEFTDTWVSDDATGTWETGIPFNHSNSTTTDEDCDSRGGIAVRTGGHPVVENITVLDWGSFWMDGSAALTKVSLLESKFSWGWAAALLDPGSYAQIRNITVTDSVLSAALISSIGMPLDIEGMLVENVATTGKLLNFDTIRGLRLSNIRMTNVASESSPIMFGCGIENMVFQDVFITGRTGYGAVTSRDMIHLSGNSCTSANPIRGNFFMNFGEDAPGTTSRLVNVNANAVDQIYGNVFQGARYFREYSAPSTEACLYSFKDTSGTYFGAEENFFIGGFAPDETGDTPFCDFGSGGSADPLPAGTVPYGIGFMRNDVIWRTTPLVGAATTNGIAAWVDAATACDTACADLGPQMECEDVVAGSNTDCADTGDVSVCGCNRAP